MDVSSLHGPFFILALFIRTVIGMVPLNIYIYTNRMNGYNFFLCRVMLNEWIDGWKNN